MFPLIITPIFSQHSPSCHTPRSDEAGAVTALSRWLQVTRITVIRATVTSPVLRHLHTTVQLNTTVQLYTDCTNQQTSSGSHEFVLRNGPDWRD